MFRSNGYASKTVNVSKVPTDTNVGTLRKPRLDLCVFVAKF